MPMAVTLHEAVAPGSVVTVQLPDLDTRRSVAAAPPPQGPSIPLPTVDAGFVEDRNAMVTSWWLYVVGWLCACCFPPCCVLPWATSALMYFCKSRQNRSQFPQQRRPACASFWTMIGLIIVEMLALIVAAVVDHGHHHVPCSMLRGAKMSHRWCGHHHHHHHHEHPSKFSWEHTPEPKTKQHREALIDKDVTAAVTAEAMPAAVPAAHMTWGAPKAWEVMEVPKAISGVK